MKTITRAAALSFVLLFAAPIGFAAEAGKGQLVLPLHECIKRAITVAPELGEAQADIELATSKLDEAQAHRYPQIEVLGLTGPIPQAKGDQVFSPNKITEYHSWTWFERGDGTLIQPLYTFGKISESMKAAGHGIEVDKSKKEQRRNEVALKVKEYYYGLLLARELKELVLEIREDLTTSREKAQKLLDKGSSNVEELDLYKFDAYLGEVGKYLEEARKGEALALSALRSRLGLPPDADLDIATERLLPGEEKTAELSAYLERSQAKRPEYKQIQEGIKARAALVEAAKAAWFPDFFVAGYLSGAYSGGRDKVVNPWVPDEFNHLWAGAAFGLKWKLDFGITGAKVAGERAQYNRLLSTKEYAETNIPLQIRKYYLDCQEAEKSTEKAKEGYASAKKWAVAAIANFDFGIGPAREIFDALQQYAKMRSAYFQAIYNTKMAQANLDYATGQEPL